MVGTEADSLAKIVWEYLHLYQTLKRCDAIFTLCSLDTRVGERAARLYLDVNAFDNSCNFCYSYICH